MKSFELTHHVYYVRPTLHTLRVLGPSNRWMTVAHYGSMNTEDNPAIFEQVRQAAIEQSDDCHMAVFHGRKKLCEYKDGVEFGTCVRCKRRTVLFDDNEGLLCPRCHDAVAQ